MNPWICIVITFSFLVVWQYITFDFEDPTVKPSFYLNYIKQFLFDSFSFLGTSFAYLSHKLFGWFHFEKFYQSILLIFEPILLSLLSPYQSLLSYVHYIKQHISFSSMIYFGSFIIIYIPCRLAIYYFRF
jgi:hypothetical protein